MPDADSSLDELSKAAAWVFPAGCADPGAAAWLLFAFAALVLVADALVPGAFAAGCTDPEAAWLPLIAAFEPDAFAAGCTDPGAPCLAAAAFAVEEFSAAH